MDDMLMTINNNVVQLSVQVENLCGGIGGEIMELTSFIDVKATIQIAVFMVGITQMAKQFLDVKNRKVKILLTVLVGIGGGLLLQFLPTWVFTTLLGVSVDVVFYDYVLKVFEKLFRGLEQ